MAAATHKADIVHENFAPEHDVEVERGHRIAVEIRSPDGAIWSGWATSLQVPESLGLMGILPRHAPLLATLEAGLTTIKTQDGQVVKIITGDGFLEISRNRVLMLVDFGEDPATVDLKRAQEARDRAISRLRTVEETVDYARAEAALRRALARLRFAGEPRGGD
jgi:F-type H+-transporting ATPase subunit epsilon